MLGSFMAVNILNCMVGASSSVWTGQNVYMGLLTSEPVMTVSNSKVTNIDYSTYEPTIGVSSYARELIGNYSLGFTQLFAGTSVYYNETDKYYYKSNTKQIKFNKASGIWQAAGISALERIFSCVSPSTTQALTMGVNASNSSSKSLCLSKPPSSRTVGFFIASMARTVDAGFVPLESLM